jgi:hypothetical protein
MPKKAEPKGIRQGGKAKAAGKPKPAAKPEDADTLDDLIEALNAPVAPQTAFNPPGRTFWPEPNGCVRGPEEADAAFDRRKWANAEPLKEMMLRNKHNAITVEARTDAELAIESMGTPGDFQRLEQEKRFEEEDRRLAETVAEARAMPRPGGVKAASPDFHLADLVFLSFANTREFFRGPHGADKPGDERYPKKTDDDDAAQTHIALEIVKFGGVSEASVRSYAACAAVGVPLGRRGGECGEPKVSEALAQLHREGLTQRLLAYLWENFPDFAEARGLPLAEGEKADAADPEAETIQTGRLFWPFIIWGGALVVLEVAFMLGAWLWGQGDNLWQKILASGPYFAGALGVCVVGFVLHAGKPGRQLLKRCKGED